MQQRFRMGKETVLQRRHRQLKLGVVAQGGDIGLQLRRVVIALVDLIRVVKEPILGDLRTSPG